MGSKAKATTTGWRRRYLVQRFERQRRVRVRLLRGSMKRQPNGIHHALVCDQRGGKWYWDSVAGVGTSAPWVTTYLIDADKTDEMVVDLAVLRMQGWTVPAGLPLW